MARGRPREFNTEEALDLALRVFWRKGFEATSLTDLTEAMGINRPSLYAAFGNKDELFRRALARYAARHTAYLHAALDQPTALAVARHMIEGNLALLTDPANPPGCLWVRGALSCAGAEAVMAEEIAAGRAAHMAEVTARFERAVAEGDLPASADATGLAAFLQAINTGLAVMASTGAGAEELRRAAAVALGGWPAA